MIFDLHIHSKYSFDSVLDPKEIVKTSKNRGLDGVALVDHGTIEGGVRAKKFNIEPDFLVIIGTEIRTDMGDIVGLFLNEEIMSKNSLEVIDEIRDQGGLSVLPHPYREQIAPADRLLKRIDLVEGFNSRSSNEQNLKAQKLAKDYEKPVIAGSDAHFSSEIGLAKTVVDGSSPREIQKILLKSGSRIEGSTSPPYLQPLSQAVKSIKTRSYQRLPIYITKSIYYYLR